jgi:surface protein
MTLRRAKPFWARKVGGGVLPFISTWRTTNTSTGSSTSTQVKLPLVSTGTYNFVVNWGDGNQDTITVWNQAETTHTYAATGDYTVTITGTITGFAFGGAGDLLKILTVSQWGSIIFKAQSTTFGGVFRNCTNLNVTATDRPIFESGQQIGFFQGCSSLVFNSSINSWNVSPITNLASFFFNCTLFNQPLSNWNVSNVTSLSQTFQGSAFNQNINTWNVNNVTNMDRTFRSCPFNQPLNSWNLNGVTITRGMFAQNTAFNQDISGWDVSTVQTFGTTGEGMFRGATAFNQNIGSWNVSAGTSFVDFMRDKTNLNYSASNLDAIYNGWTNRSLATGITISFGTIKYTTSGQAGRDLLTRTNATVTVTNATNNGSGLIRITTGSAHGRTTGDKIFISGVTGTTEANGGWIVTVINATTIDLQASTFTNTYVSGGTVRTGYGWTITDGGL